MTEPRHAPNMADVAARAGVSHQTVWRVISGFAGVRESTRARVLAAVDELGYRRNLAASRLATSRSTVIGVLGPATPNFGPTSSLYAVERAIRDAGYHPLISSSDPERVRDDLDFLLDQSLEALVVIAPYRSTLEAIRALQPKIPIVVLQAGRTRVGTAVTIDQGAGVRYAVQHLLGLGHTRIQHLSGPPDFIEATLRSEAFEREIARHGLPALPVIPGDWSAESGYRAAQQLDPATTALFCGNDHMAIGVIHALSERGLRVPDDLSVIGFDDVPEAAHALPPLTTVHQDFAQVGRRAVAALLAQLAEEGAPATVSIEPELVERRSAGAPRS